MIKITDIKVGDKVLITSDKKLIGSWYLPERFAGTIQTVRSIDLDNMFFMVDGDASGYSFGPEHIVTIVRSAADHISIDSFKKLKLGDEVKIVKQVNMSDHYKSGLVPNMTKMCGLTMTIDGIYDLDSSEPYVTFKGSIYNWSYKLIAPLESDNSGIFVSSANIERIHEYIHEILNILNGGKLQ